MPEHEPAAVLTVITCRCGENFDGFTELGAWRDFEEHQAKHERVPA